MTFKNEDKCGVLLWHNGIGSILGALGRRLDTQLGTVGKGCCLTACVGCICGFLLIPGSETPYAGRKKKKKKKKKMRANNHTSVWKLFFWLFQRHAEVLRPGIKPAPQQQSRPPQWQYKILNLLCHRTPENSQGGSESGQEQRWWSSSRLTFYYLQSVVNSGLEKFKWGVSLNIKE